MYFLPLALFFDGIRHMFALMTNRCGVISGQSHSRIFTIRRGAAGRVILPSFGVGFVKYFLNGRLLQNRLGYVIICVYYSAYGMCRPFCPFHLRGPLFVSLICGRPHVGYGPSINPARSVPPCGHANRCARHNTVEKRSNTEYECKARDSYSLLQ